MKFKSLSLVLCVGLILICLHAIADTPILIITGMVINEDNSEANQIKVYVVNKTKTDTATPKWIYTTTDNNGRYQVLLMEMETQLKVASNGDEFLVTIIDKNNVVVARQSHIVTTKEINSKHAMINVRIPAPPVAVPQTVIIDEDTTKLITLIAESREEKQLTYQIIRPPKHGKLSPVSQADFAYTPDQDYHGPDSFVFNASDGVADSRAVKVTLTIHAINDAPVAIGQSVTATEDTPVTIHLSVTDLEGGPFSYSIVSPPQNGHLSGKMPNPTYISDPNFEGTDTFTFKANDGTNDSQTATVIITVDPINDSPVAVDQAITISENKSQKITLFAYDHDHDELTYHIVKQPNHGRIFAVDNTNVNYIPNSNFEGTDTFTFKVNDGTSHSQTATVTLKVKEQIPLVTFWVDVPQTTWTAKIGTTTSFDLLIRGEKGFQEAIDLSINLSTLPVDTKIVPERKSISPGSSSQKVTITLTTTNSTPIGQYTISVVLESASDSKTVELVLFVEEKVKLAGDANGDNQVDILDLVLVAGSFGLEGENLPQDVNQDGWIDILDLVMIAANFGQITAAPKLLSGELNFTAQQKQSIQSAIVGLERMSVRSKAEEAALNVLNAILPERLPTETQLLPNYPNPFNPETWIPFELAKDAEVSIKIFDASGQVIRQIGLGYLNAGSYASRRRAAYWNGRSDLGEYASSGVYFCQISAGRFSAMRKMVIMK
mgnify:CR=1 FL=1